jgi:hypothetical protein
MALACAQHGWPVFPCQPDQKTPASRHGYLDATTDRAQVAVWFAGHPERNLAIATGAPGPDILDIDYYTEAENGYPALARLRDAGLLEGAAARVDTPSGGRHYYFAGSHQRTSHLAAQHLDFLAIGGYVIAPPSRVDGRLYKATRIPGERRGLDWDAAVQLLEPSRSRQRHVPQPAASPTADRLDALAHWVAGQQEGNRNAGLFWAANRVLDDDRAADLTPLAAAARQAGLEDPEITRTLDSARRISQGRPKSPGHQAEAAI